MKTILVTGGAGYIGSHTVKELLKNGYKVLVYDNLSSGHKWAVLRPAKLIVGDLLDEKKLSATLKKYKPDAVMHFAASIEAGESMERPGDFFTNNVTATLNLLKAMQKSNIKKMIFSSSAAVYGDPKRVPLKEDAELLPINAYGSTKMIDEEMLKYFDIAHEIKYISLRYFNAAGADPEGELGAEHKSKTHLVTRAILAADKKIPTLEIFGTDYKTKDGTCIRDYIHVTDLAIAHILALGYLEKKKESDIFNLGNEKGNSVSEVVKKTQEVTDQSFKVKYSKRRAGDPAKLVASSIKAKKILGWKPKYSELEAIIKTAWDWQTTHKKSIKKK